jgi:hypothetical protein
VPIQEHNVQQAMFYLKNEEVQQTQQNGMLFPQVILKVEIQHTEQQLHRQNKEAQLQPTQTEIVTHQATINLEQIPGLLITQIEQVAQRRAATTKLQKQEAHIADRQKAIQNQVIKFHQQALTLNLPHTEVVALEIATVQLRRVLLQEAIQAEVHAQVAVLVPLAEAATQVEVLVVAQAEVLVVAAQAVAVLVVVTVVAAAQAEDN